MNGSYIVNGSICQTGCFQNGIDIIAEDISQIILGALRCPVPPTVPWIHFNKKKFLLKLIHHCLNNRPMGMLP